MPLRSVGYFSSVLTLVLLLGAGIGVRAEEPKAEAKPEATPDAKDAGLTGPEFDAQGEYVGSVSIPGMGETKIGVQIIALGDGKFSAISYIGGLPGDGWDRGKRSEGKGEMTDGLLEIDKGKQYSSQVKNDVLTVLVGGEKFTELKKVHRESPTLGAPRPAGAIVLFDGSSADKFENGKMTNDGLLMPGCKSKEKFGSGTLHLEFRVPFMPEARKQKRGRSGVFLQGRYEVQILDSFGEKEVNHGCGAIVGLKTPDLNTCYPPGSWQTFDIDFKAAEYERGRKAKDPFITVRLNHEIVARKTMLHHATQGAPVAVGEEPGPIVLDDRGDAVRFRNIWFLNEKTQTPVENAAKAK